MREVIYYIELDVLCMDYVRSDICKANYKARYKQTLKYRDGTLLLL